MYDYRTGKHYKVILTAKLKNAVQRLPFGDRCTFNLKNTSVNGEKRGCSGFISLKDRHVYVDTEASVYGPLSDKVMYRTAKSIKDYSGGFNQWCDADADTLARCVMKLFEKEAVM